MSRKVLILLVNMFLCCAIVGAQEVQKSELQQKAEAADKEGTIATARYMYIRAFEDYVNKGNMKQAVDCGIKATGLYYRKDYYWKEAFDLLRRIDDTINASQQTTAADKAALHYEVTKERLQMYTKLRKSANAMEQLNVMEAQADASGEESLKNDLLYNKAIYYYTFGQNAQGDAVFKEMATKLTASKEYDKVETAYQTLIANGRRSNSANLVAQSYKSYVAWKDSVSALKTADEIGALKKKIEENEAAISEKDSSLTARMAIIIGLCVLAAILAAVLAVGGVVLMRFILQTRRQKKIIKLANDNNALKAKFIKNISAQLEPSLRKLDGSIPEVKALLDFSGHVQTLSELECSTDDIVELEDTQLPSFCEGLMDQIRDKVRRDVSLTLNVPKMSAKLNKEYVSHILLHLLSNAAEYTPEGGSICLDFKKRGAHANQFLVSNTGQPIAEELQEDLFKPFLEIKDLTTGDGLGLPICKQMALKMNGDLTVDPNFVKGARFVLDLHS